MIRAILYIIVIVIFKRYLLDLYESIVNNWPIFSTLIVCIFLNLAYFFYVTDDIKYTLMAYKWPLLMLVTLSMAAYGTVFYSMKRFMELYTLKIEKLKFQNETGRLYLETIKLEKYANYDTLTGLPNRRFFFKELEMLVSESEKNATMAAILFIDLDTFKDINDTYGHQVGDDVLITVGNRLVKCIRETDFVARLGGDEFAVLIPTIENMTSLENLAKRIHKEVQEPIVIGRIEYSINSSIGIAVYPDTGMDSESLLSNADTAMYEIKKNGKGGIGFFMGPMNSPMVNSIG